MKISDSVVYIGADDKDIDLFESQYKVPNGVTYNSYVILDEKIAVMDTVDKRRTQQWMDNLEKVLDGKKPRMISFGIRTFSPPKDFFGKFPFSAFSEKGFHHPVPALHGPGHIPHIFYDPMVCKRHSGLQSAVR